MRRGPTNPIILRSEEKIPFGIKCRQWGAKGQEASSLRHPRPVTPDSLVSSCNHTGTRLQSHRDSSWRYRGQGMRAWPSGTGPVVDSKKICNTHCSLEQGVHKEHYWVSWWGLGLKGTPRSFLGLPKDCLSEIQSTGLPNAKTFLL